MIWSRELLNKLDEKLKDGVIAVGGVTIDRAALVTEIAQLFSQEADDRCMIVKTACAHRRTRPYIPEFSTGDESDYTKVCNDCGSVLR